MISLLSAYGCHGLPIQNSGSQYAEVIIVEQEQISTSFRILHVGFGTRSRCTRLAPVFQVLQHLLKRISMDATFTMVWRGLVHTGSKYSAVAARILLIDIGFALSPSWQSSGLRVGDRVGLRVGPGVGPRVGSREGGHRVGLGVGRGSV